MTARSPNTGRPLGARNVEAVAAANRHGTQSRRQPSSARDNLQFGFLRQVAKRPLGLVAGNGHTKENAVNTQFSAAAAIRPTSTRRDARP
jgi:hypothetical protein